MFPHSRFRIAGGHFIGFDGRHPMSLRFSMIHWLIDEKFHLLYRKIRSIKTDDAVTTGNKTHKDLDSLCIY